MRSTVASQRLGGAAGDRDPCAGLGEGLRERGADAATAARDQGDEAVEAEDVELAHRCSFARLIDYRR